MPSFKRWLHSEPIGLEWRSGSAFVTLVIAVGIGTDGLVYSLPVAVIPFQLGKLGYDQLSSKTGWLLFAYAAGLVVCTAPVAYVSERYQARRLPLLLALIALQGSLVMFMLAPNYALMLLARAIQGGASAVVWTVGIALLCDVVPTEKLGQQLGLAVTGLSLGAVAGPPLGGVLYQRFGFYAPFILGLALALVDFAGRLMVVEPDRKRRWRESTSSPGGPPGGLSATPFNASIPLSETAPECRVNHTQLVLQEATRAASASSRKARLPLLRLLSSSLALTASLNTFLYGMVFGSLDSTLSLRLWDVFGFTSQTVGLVYIAAVVPTAFSGIITGWISDRYGPKWVTIACELLAVPWFGLLVLKKSLALFIVCLALGCFFSSGIVSPVMVDLAIITGDLEGIGYAHVYGLFNIAFSIAAGVGPVVGSQMYDHLSDGWTAVCLFCSASMIAGVVPTILFASKGTSARPTQGVAT